MGAKVIIIIPAYNEEQNILGVIEEIKRSCPSFDYIVINDCSDDETERVLLDNCIPHIAHPINLGIGGAVQTGYKFAYKNGYDVAIQLDGDGQHDASQVAKLVRAIKDGADISIGSRFINKEGFQSSWIRRLGIKLLSGTVFLCSGKRILDVTSGFRAVNRLYIERYANAYPQDYPEPEAIVFALVRGAKIVEVPVTMRERKAGKSSIAAFKSIYYMIKVNLAILLCYFSEKKRRRNNNAD